MAMLFRQKRTKENIGSLNMKKIIQPETTEEVVEYEKEKTALNKKNIEKAKTL